MVSQLKENTVPPELSIIIPVYEEQRIIGDCLDYLSLLRGIEKTEVIIVDGKGGSTIESIPAKNYPFRFKTLTSERGRGVQLNRGAEVSRAKNLLFLP